MANKLQLAHERRKLSLRAVILGNRAKVATLQEQTKRAREELKAMSPGKSRSNNPLDSLKTVRIR